MTARANLFSGLTGRRAAGAGFAFVLGSETLRATCRAAVGDFVEAEQRFDVSGVKFVRLAARPRVPLGGLPSDLRWVFSAWLDTTQIVELAVGPALNDIAIPIGTATGDHRIAYRLELAGTPGTFNVELPAVYLDAIALDTDTAGIALANRIPAQNSTGVSATDPVQFDVIDVDGTAAPVLGAVYVNGVLAHNGVSFQAGFTGSVTSILGGFGRRVLVQRSASFGSAELVTIRVQASNVNGALDETYAFETLDTEGPVLTAAIALDRTQVELRFDEAATITSVAFEIAAPDGFPAVPITAVSWSGGPSQVATVTLDTEMTPNMPYVVEVGAFDALGNVATSSFVVVGYACAQPANRDFSLWEMLPLINRSEDAWPFDLRRFIRALQEVADWLLCDIDRFTRIFDVDLASERFLDAMLVQLGNPFPFDLTLAEKRRLVGLLVQIYKLKGTADGIVNTIRVFTGIDVSILYPGWATGWELGLHELGEDTILGTDDAAIRYSYRIVSPITLDADQRHRIRTIATFMHPAHEHLIEIIEPAPPPDIPDHWELGLSELGETTLLH